MSFKFHNVFGHVGYLTFRSRGIKALTFATLLVLASAAVAGERIGRFCPDCMNEASAQLVAESMAPPPATGPGCGGVIPLGGVGDAVKDAEDSGVKGASCAVPTRRVFIANQNTGMVYAFTVWTEGSLPNATALAMSSEEQLVAQHAIDLRLAWDALMEDLAEHGPSTLAPPEFPSIRSFRGETLQVSEECPTGTALDTYLAPSGLPSLSSNIALYATLGLAPFDNLPTRRSFLSRLSGITIMAATFGIGFQWEPSVPPPVYHFETFGASEAAVNEDQLAFELALVSDHQGRMIATVEFRPELSRVAGMPIADFEQGAPLDACSAEKLLQSMDESGATFHSPPGDPNPSPFPTNLVPPGAGIDRRICSQTFSVRVDGQVVSTHTINVFCAQL